MYESVYIFHCTHTIYYNYIYFANFKSENFLILSWSFLILQYVDKIFPFYSYWAMERISFIHSSVFIDHL